MHVRTKVYLDEETLAALETLSRRSAKSRADLIRDALRAFVGSGITPPLPSGLGLIETEPADDTPGKRKGNQTGPSRRVM